MFEDTITNSEYKHLTNARPACAQGVYNTHSVCVSVYPLFASSKKRLYNTLNVENRLYAKFKRFSDLQISLS